MSRPLRDEPIEALERYLDEFDSDEARLLTLLHELSYRGPDAAWLKDRAEETRIHLIIANARNPRPRPVAAAAPIEPEPVAEARDTGMMVPVEAIEMETAEATIVQATISPPQGPELHPSKGTRAHPDSDDLDDDEDDDLASAGDIAPTRNRSGDFPGYDPAPMQAEMGRPLIVAPSAEDRWRGPDRHLGVLALAVIGFVGLTGAYLMGAFDPMKDSVPDAARAPSLDNVKPREVTNLPGIPLQNGGVQTAGLAPVSAVAPQPPVPGSIAPERMNLTTDLANLYDGEGPAIARAAVAAAGLGVNQTVRWQNEKSGRHGSVTLIAQNLQKPNCYTARIARLDTKSPQRRTQQLCF